MLLMIAFGYGLIRLGDLPGVTASVHALKLVAVAVVAQAIWSMAQSLCPDRLRGSLALGAAACLLIWPSAMGQLAVILLAGVMGWRLCSPARPQSADPLSLPMARGPAIALLATFGGLLLLALLPSGVWPVHGLELAAAMFRSGALVFGGGHVVGRGDSAHGLGQPGGLSGWLWRSAGPAWPIAHLCGLSRHGRGADTERCAWGDTFYDPVLTTAVSDGRDAAVPLGAFALLVL
ncbi:hypothetical protein CCR82_02010 [Halochromatium salexigens]|uniref:Uncharacterized protein n=1 Tax=Halochromatium salexigens TaxID=49447 RepID=A0AAJ0UD99_HALSE|nr:hypothetical protein [Halochromatium salexigens]